jgi:galactitol-specific phosphotransferase system IIB component
MLFTLSLQQILPFMSSAAREAVRNTLHEWQTDALAAASTSNAVIEGDEATLDASVATTRVSNHTQIMDKTVVITGTQEAVDKAGRASELAYQIAKKSKELKRDIEATLLINQAKVAGDATTARKFGSISSWIATNDSFGTSGASPTGDGF